ncbi:GntR family transcriptional regulator [Halieaceae bacterium IMCC8485]|uniref:GntR family transcriptional regulator n=1 Tax=Candidatus Seongchinamella marina TaxID=2518990 RepID=A0ABT3SQS7_9GAMM|nr:GntR family transcriptional regulator [Candidatus Seongchinamella marina]MBT5006750.1 GntR family transcriptional regulator [Halieaceae bacterium]MCX2972338.1 GntR family transcriptional regulator [Candidatus Seongchinamella marina]
MTVEWNDKQPIYRQLRDLVAERIMDGSFPEGEAIPSVRQVSADYKINHLTVGKAYQELVDEGLLEKRRGLGMFVTVGACCALTSNEKQQFIDEEVSAFLERAKVLGMDTQEVVGLLLETGGRR